MIISKEFAKAAVFDKNGRLLLTKRSSRDKFSPNHWEMPVGELKVGESTLKAALRETAEEAGIVPKIHHLFPIHEKSFQLREGGLGIMTLHLFLHNMSRPKVKVDGKETVDGRFYSLEQIRQKKLLINVNNQELIKIAFKAHKKFFKK
ncbi:MAG: NUDIX hydrolase [Candidatus Micrarchaeota archaeon]